MGAAPAIVPSATAPVVPESAAAASVEPLVMSASFDGGDGRRALFGGMESEIEAIHLSDGVDGSGFPAFDDPTATVGEHVVARIDVILRNTTGGPLLFPQHPRLRLAGNPVEVTARLAEYDTTVVAEGSSARASFDFELTADDAAVDPGLLTGAPLLLVADDTLRDGIPLGGAPHEPLRIEPIRVGASVFRAGDAGRTLTVTSVEPTLEAQGWLGSGADEAEDYRAPDDEVWLLANLTLDCVGRLPGLSCYFGLEQTAVRIETDDQVVGFGQIPDWSISDAVVDVSAGGSTKIDVMLRVPVSDTYVLLLG